MSSGYVRDEWQPFLENTFGIFQNRQSFNVKLKFSLERSRWIRGEVWHEGQTEELQEDGSLILTIPVSHEQEIMMEILKHGSHVKVMEPGWLRGMLFKELSQTIENYHT